MGAQTESAMGGSYSVFQHIGDGPEVSSGSPESLCLQPGVGNETSSSSLAVPKADLRELPHPGLLMEASRKTLQIRPGLPQPGLWSLPDGLGAFHANLTGPLAGPLAGS